MNTVSALLAACERFLGLGARIRAMDAAGSGPDGQLDGILADRYLAIDVIADTRPLSAASVRAKARVVVAAFEADVPSQSGETVEEAATRHEWVAYRFALDVLSG